MRTIFIIYPSLPVRCLIASDVGRAKTCSDCYEF
jgi:hypothetical protein